MAKTVLWFTQFNNVTLVNQMIKALTIYFRQFWSNAEIF